MRVPVHIMLMSVIQRVVPSQQQVLYKKLKEVVSTELDTKQVVHSTFQVQYHAEGILKRFERRLIVKFDEWKASSSGSDGM